MQFMPVPTSEGPLNGLPIQCLISNQVGLLLQLWF